MRNRRRRFACDANGWSSAGRPFRLRPQPVLAQDRAGAAAIDHTDACGGNELWPAAGAAILARDEYKYSDVLVTFVDGSVGTASATAVFAKLAEVFRTIAAHDPLTNLPNRRVLEQVGRQLMAQAGSERTIALLYVDIDRFKDVNDVIGHRVGDVVLTEFARRLQQCTTDDDLVVRMGGDEFAVLLTQATPTTANAIAEHIVLSAAAPFVIDGRVVTLGASVGIAFPNDAMPERTLGVIDVLIRHADAAMYQAKRSGTGVVNRVGYAVDTSQYAGSAAAIARRIPAAMDEGLFAVHYQPIVDVTTRRTVEMEALLRWDDPKLGPIEPARFIPIAEHAGHIIDLGRFVITTACEQARRWRDAGNDWVIAVNLSPLQLLDPELVGFVHVSLISHGITPDRLRFEVTESQAIRDATATGGRLRELRNLGVRISLDDFGTGYSSLSMLRQLPIDTIKIDRSFINRIDADGEEADQDTSLVRLVVEIARVYGLSVVAEGIERESQLAQLAQMGCPYAQGFLLGHPALADAHS